MKSKPCVTLGNMLKNSSVKGKKLTNFLKVIMIIKPAKCRKIMIQAVTILLI